MRERAIAVVIPVRNAESGIAATIAAVAIQLGATGSQCELVVVDDASTDQTATVAATALSAVDMNGQLVRRDLRGGPNASRNTGVLATSASVVVLLDGDDEPLPGCIAALAGGVVDDLVIAGGSYLIPGNRGRQSVVPASSRTAFGYRYAVGGACAMSRALFTRVGGFDENIARGGSELEFSITAQVRYGARIVDVDEAQVLHRVPRTLVNRARVHFLRERGHQYIRRSLPAASPSANPSPSRTAWPIRAERAGGWLLLGAEVGGRTAGRIVYGHLTPAKPVARGRAGIQTGSDLHRA